MHANELDSRDTPPELTSLVEAVLFAGATAADVAHLAESLDVTADQLVAAVAELNQRYARQGRPYEIRRAGAGYQLVLRPKFYSTLRRLHGRTRDVRLSLAAIEVLSLVAYRQPISVHEIDAIRGVDSGAVVRQLRRRNLIQPAASAESSPSPRYEVTRRFLQHFHLSSMDELPRVQELEKA
jgi:segregation and condensation protein B